MEAIGITIGILALVVIVLGLLIIRLERNDAKLEQEGKMMNCPDCEGSGEELDPIFGSLHRCWSCGGRCRITRNSVPQHLGGELPD